MMLMLGLILTTCSIIQLIVKEKRNGTLKVLRVMGLREFVYWASWQSVFTVFFVPVGLVFAFVGKFMTEIKVLLFSFTRARGFYRYSCTGEGERCLYRSTEFLLKESSPQTAQHFFPTLN